MGAKICFGKEWSNRREGIMGKKKLWKLYSVKDGKIIRKTKFCPVCGIGVYLAKHADRYYCGKCGYTEYIKPKKKSSLLERLEAEIKKIE